MQRPFRYKTQAAIQRAEELGIDPWDVLLYFVAGDWKSLGYESEKRFISQADGSMREEYTIPPTLRANCAAAAVQYLKPKLKAVEVSGDLNATMTLTAVSKADLVAALKEDPFLQIPGVNDGQREVTEIEPGRADSSEEID